MILPCNGMWILHFGEHAQLRGPSLLRLASVGRHVCAPDPQPFAGGGPSPIFVKRNPQSEGHLENSLQGSVHQICDFGVASLSCIKRFGVRQHGKLGSISNAELAINMVQMDFDSPLGQP